MPSTPTSKSQVQAYRFMIRRMQSALVRKDPVMLHDPMRTHSRATVVGAVLAVVALAGFLVYALLKPAGQLPNQGVLVSAQSGRVYVYAGTPPQLIPTFNVASARLLFAVIQNKGKPPSSQQSNSVSAAGVRTVDDASLQGIPVNRLMGIPDGPDLIPSGDEQRAKGKWAVCDNIQREPDLNNPTANGNFATTVLGGLDNVGNALPPGQALLVQAPDQQAYLIYRTPSTVNTATTNSNSDAVRAKVDLSDHAVMTAFNLVGITPRPISTGLLNAIPQVRDLKLSEDIAGKNNPDSFGLNINVGGVFGIATPAGIQYYLVLADGIEQINASAATLVRAKVNTGNATIPSLPQSSITSVPQKNEIDFSSFPDVVPQILDATSYPTVCLGWSSDLSDPQFPKEHTEVTVGQKLPLPDRDAVPVPIGSPNANGVQVNAFWMQPGTAAIVRSASGPAGFRSGPIFLVSSRGVKYGVPDQVTANIIGLTDPDPAPDAIVGLLPSGAELDTQSALKTYDSVNTSADSGSYASTIPGVPSGQAAAGSPGTGG